MTKNASLDVESTEEEKVEMREFSRKGMLKFLSERRPITIFSGIELVRRRQLQTLHAIIPSHYSEEAVLGLDGMDYSQLPKLDEPFQCADQHFIVTDDAIVEVCEAEYASYEVQRTHRPPPAIIAFLKSIKK